MRDFNRYTGDGLPNEPVGHPLPSGDPSSGAYVPTKQDLRDWAEAIEGYVGDASIVLTKAGNLSGVGDQSAARTNIGLGSVDNTPDASKPISAAQAAANQLEATSRKASLRQSKDYRNGVSGYAWAVSDAANKVAMGITEAGNVSLADYEMFATGNREISWAIVDADGKMGMGLDYQGNVVANDYRHTTPVGREGAEFVWTVQDDQGKVALGVRQDGSLSTGPTINITPEQFSTTIPNANPRQYIGYKSAMRIDNSTYSVRKNDGQDAALIQSQEPVQLLVIYGQSNAYYTGAAGGPLLANNPFPEISTRMSSGAWFLEAANDELILSSGDVAPLLDDNSANNTTLALTSYAIEAMSRNRLNGPSAGIISFGSAVGGQPLDSFIKGTVPYENLRRAARAAQVVAAKHGREIELPGIIFVQGEAGPNTGYKAILEQLISDLKSDLVTDLGLATPPRFLILQTNDGDTAGNTFPQPEIDQLAAVGGIVAGPMYQQPFVDSVHGTALGRMVLSDMLADVFFQIKQSGTYTPLRPISAVITGTTIDVQFAVPGDGLILDDDWVKAATDYGFTVKTDTNTATLYSIAILSTDTVRITLPAVPAGANLRVEYALWQDSIADGWAAGRGQLYSPARTPSLYYNMGYDVPKFARHYAVRFQQEVTL
jgi:hypothetical protein